jgi:acetyl esterase/lipase
MVPTNDALRDESFQFSLRLAKLGIDIKIREYQSMPHGYLNYNSQILGMRDESNVTIN